MYTFKFHSQNAIKFKNNEIFISTANIFDNEIEWCIPETIKDRFCKFINNVNIEVPHSDEIKDKIISWYAKELNINSQYIKISSSIDFVINEIQEYNKIVKYNQLDNFDFNDNSWELNWYKDKNQKVCIIIRDNKIASIASDNGNGAVTVDTKKEYRNQGFSSECLRRLIYEYQDNKNAFVYPTTLDNYPAIRVAEKCGMKKTQTGYWIRINESIGSEIIQKRKDLFNIIT